MQLENYMYLLLMLFTLVAQGNLYQEHRRIGRGDDLRGHSNFGARLEQVLPEAPPSLKLRRTPQINFALPKQGQ